MAYVQIYNLMIDVGETTIEYIIAIPEAKKQNFLEKVNEKL